MTSPSPTGPRATMVHREDIAQSAYDLKAEVTVRLSRINGGWHFEGIAFPNGGVLGAVYEIRDSKAHDFIESLREGA